MLALFVGSITPLSLFRIWSFNEPLLFTIFVLLATLITFILSRHYDWSGPTVLAVVFLVAGVVTSYLGHIRLASKLIIYPIDWTMGFIVLIIGLLGFTSGVATVWYFGGRGQLRFKEGTQAAVKPLGGHLTVLDQLATIGLILSIAGLLAFFARYGVTMFSSGNIDSWRFTLLHDPSTSYFNHLTYFGSFLLPIKLCTFVLLPKRSSVTRYRDILLMATQFLLLVLYGTKALFIFPVASFLLLYHYMVRPIRLRVILKWSPLLLIALQLMVMYTNYRGLGRAISNDLISDIFIVTFPEFRGMAETVDIAVRYNAFLPQSSYPAIILGALPKELVAFLGLSKESVLSVGGLPISYYYKELMGESFPGGSARIGIVGELFMNSGLSGVFAGMLVYGAVIAWLDAFLQKTLSSKNKAWIVPLIVPVTVQLLWLVVSELTTNLPLTYEWLYYSMAMGMAVHVVHNMQLRRAIREDGYYESVNG